MKLRALLGLGLVVLSLAAPPVRAAFELADASPAALGAVSLEAPAEPLASFEAPGFRAGTSHASLFQVPDLVAERLSLETPVPGGRAGASWTLVRAPGARESSASLAWRQGAGAPLRLGARLERLDFTAEGAAPIGGFAVGAAATARLLTGGVALEGDCAADRLLRSGSLERAGVRPALTAGLACTSRGARVRYAERWDASGTRSPVLTLDLPLGRALTARFGRGAAPGRVGVALAARLGGIEVSWGRLDFASGGTITAVGLAWTGRRGGARAEYEGSGKNRQGHAEQKCASVAAPGGASPRTQHKAIYGITNRTVSGIGGLPRTAASRGCSRDSPAPARGAAGLPQAASLLALWPSATMRRCGRIRRRAAAFAAVASGVFVAAGAARADSSAVWLPPPREEVEAAERLDEPPVAASARGSVLARFGRSGAGTWEVRRLSAVWASARQEAPRARGRAVELGVVKADGRPAATLAVSTGGIRVAAGRLTLEEAPWLFARRLGLARAAARVPEPRTAAVRAGPPLGVSTPAAGGLAAEWTARSVAAWALGGRDAGTAEPVGTAGCAIRVREAHGLLGIGRSGKRWCLVAAGAVKRRRAVASLEMLLGNGRPAASAAVATRGSDVTFWCRWRMLAGEPRPAAGEAGAAARGRYGSIRLTWRAWTQAARADNGALELEAATRLGSGRAIRARVGERRDGAAPTGDLPEGGPPERYAVLDATLVRAGSRSLAFLASARRAAGGARSGRMLGARLRAGAEGASRLTLLVQATRTGEGASAPGPELSLSGQSTLAERTRSGIVFAARGVARRGPLELGGLWQREEDADGARPRSASVWMRWYL